MLNKDPDRIVKFVFPALLALLATPVMSGIVTAWNLGVDDGFFAAWWNAWMVSLPAGLFVVYVVSPIARDLTARAAHRLAES